MSICPNELTDSAAPFTFMTRLEFASNSGKSDLSTSSLFSITTAGLASKALIDSLGLLCQKGATFTTSKRIACSTGFKSLAFKVPDRITWNSLVRVPDSQKGKNFIIYGCVAQFDTNTGGSKFRAYVSAGSQDYYGPSGTNAILSGSAKQLLGLSRNDEFIARVNVSGALSYDTLGGRTKVPAFVVRDFQKTGTC